CTVSALAASNPGLEDMVLDRLPMTPRVVLHHPMISGESGHELMASYRQAIEGTLGAEYVLVVEGSIPDDQVIEPEGHYAAFGIGADWPQSMQPPRRADQPLRATDWIWAMAPRAAACVAIGTCATWGGIPAAAGNITGSMGLMDYLGRDYRSARGVPVINVPGCAPIGDNFTEALSQVFMFLDGFRPLPEFDELGRPE
ncbi:MAG: hydrogenase expression protein HypE, partial [Pyrinomonadaceae bacterium]